ncbi:hypothetical protein GCM10023088_45280 [Actinomadura verrucosospora]
MRAGREGEDEEQGGEDAEGRAGAQGLTPSLQAGWRIPPNPEIVHVLDRKVSYLFRVKVASGRGVGKTLVRAPCGPRAGVRDHPSSRTEPAPAILEIGNSRRNSRRSTANIAR